MNPKLDSQK